RMPGSVTPAATGTFTYRQTDSSGTLTLNYEASGRDVMQLQFWNDSNGQFSGTQEFQSGQNTFSGQFTGGRPPGEYVSSQTKWRVNYLDISSPDGSLGAVNEVKVAAAVADKFKINLR